MYSYLSVFVFYFYDNFKYLTIWFSGTVGTYQIKKIIWIQINDDDLSFFCLLFPTEDVMLILKIWVNLSEITSYW